MRLYPFQFTLSWIMIATAGMAVLLARESIWVGIGFTWMPDPANRRVLADPSLTFWFIPCLTIAFVRARQGRRLKVGSIVTIAIALMSWLVLRRPCIITPGNVYYWPDDVLFYIHERFVVNNSIGIYFPAFLPSTARELVGLLALVVFLLFFALALTQPVSRRLRLVIAVGVNGYSCLEWAAFMWLERGWGVGQPPRNPLAGPIPRANAVDIFRGLALLVLLTYLISILMRSCMTTEETQPLQARSSSTEARLAA
jgi:hypothetical protein